MQGALAVPVVDDHVGLDGGVGRGQQLDPLVRQPPAIREASGDLGQAQPLPEPEAAGDVGAEVAVAEPEPPGLDTEGAQLGHDLAAVTLPTPALLLVDGAAQRVEDGVQVRADPQAEERDVVAGVADHRDPRRVRPGPVRKGTDQAADEAGATDAAGERTVICMVPLCEVSGF